MKDKIYISYEPEGVYIVEPGGMHFRTLGSLQVYTPRASEEVRFRMLLEEKLRRNTKPGDYTGKKANKIIQELFAHAQAEVKRLLPRVASRSFFEFLVYVHSQWGRLMIKAQHRLLEHEDAEVYWRDGPLERRTLRYLIEECVRLTEQEAPDASKEQLLSYTDRVYIAARYLVLLSNISDQLQFFYPEQAVLTIFSPRQETYFEYCLTPTAQAMFDRFEKFKREHHTSGGEELEDFATVWHVVKERLNEPFGQEIGVPIERAFGICLGLKDFTSPPKDSFDVLFIPEQGLHNAIAVNYSVSEKSVRRMMAGLTLTNACLEAERREIFDTKRHFQARFRPFAKLPHPSGYHLAWDAFTLEQALPELIGNITFCGLPAEWDLPAISKRLQEVVQILSKRFVCQVRNRFERVEWRCITEIERLVDANGVFHRIAPGEIDVLAVSPDGATIAQVECKRLRPSVDTRSYRDDISDFYGNGKFLDKTKRKQGWLKSNLPILVSHLRRSLGLPVKDNATIRPVFLTLFPNFAETRATEIPVLTAEVFFHKLAHDPSFWPETISRS